MNSNPSPSHSDKPAPLAESLPTDDAPAKRAPNMRRQAAPLQREDLGPVAEQHLRQANLCRVRGDVPGSIRELRSALDAHPSSARLHEMLGDLLAQTGETTSAIESYRRAQSIGAGASVEAKIGRLLLGRAVDVETIGDGTLVRGGGWLPIVASALMPGLGLALSGQMESAAVGFGGCLISLALMFVIPGTRSLLAHSLGGAAAAASPGIVLLAIFLGLMYAGFWVYSMWETVRVAKPAGKEE